MPDGERGDHQNEGPRPPERDHQTQEKQQVVQSVENVKEAETHEPKCRLVPAWIHSDDAGVAKKFVWPNRAVGQHETHYCKDAKSQSIRPGTYRKLRPVRPDRKLQNGIEHQLLPHDLGRWIEPGPRYMIQRRFIGPGTAVSEGSERRVAAIAGVGRRTPSS